MGWRETYRSKLVTVEEAARRVSSGDRIFIGHGMASPRALVEAIAERAEELEGVQILSSLTLYPYRFMSDPACIGHIDYHTMFATALDRGHVRDGTVHLTSVHLSRIDVAITRFNPNVFLADVSEPDEEGYVYYGPLGVHTNTYGERCASLRIVQVNRHQPRVRGDGRTNRIHVSAVDLICESDHELPEYVQPPVTESEQRIAEHVLARIEDGSTIQLGLGGIANAVGFGLAARRDLAIHSEMFTDSMMALQKAGVLTGPVRCAFALGSRALMGPYLWEAGIAFAPTPEINDVVAIAAHPRMVSINCALLVDLTGQVASEGVGHYQISGTGGQLDFVRGAARSRGGQSFLCLHSTRTDPRTGATTSTILRDLPPGTPITTPRADVMSVVTEYGIADLWCRPIEDRVHALIAIAHPQFREQLRTDAIEAGLIRA
ncbi:MAG: 4-hydroxybutyrate CoA-transferase [Actinomycetales bacterium]|nr:4-hydroxybutyrate CoA-transferase [Actinomycetales bacterium]